MPTNDFKPFATAGGANVSTQAEYLALAALSTGWQSGKASSKEVNKAVRQATFIAAALAQFVSDKGAVDVLDDGNLAGFGTNLIAAMNKTSQPLDATLTALAALVGAANKLPYFNGADTAALTDLTQVGRDIIGKADVAAVLTYLGIPNPFLIQQKILPASTDLNSIGGDSMLGIYSQPTHASATTAKNYPEDSAGMLMVLPSAFGGMQVYITYNGVIWQRQTSNNWNGSGPWGIWIKTPSINDLNNKQPLDSTLTAIAELNGSANKLPYFTGSESAGLTDLTAFARTLLSRNTGADVLSDLGLSSGFGWVNLPGGKILQWNRGNTGDGGNRFTFPIPFPHQCHGVVATPFMTIDGAVINAGSSIATIFVSSATISNTGFFAKYATGASSNEFFWFAIGE